MTAIPDKQTMIRALFDPWVFCALLNFKDAKGFVTLHKQLMAFLMAPQALTKLESELDARRLSSTHPVFVIEGQWYVLNDRHDEFRKRMVLLPRGHYKSTVSVLYWLWRFYRNPNIRLTIGCDDTGLSGSFLREMTQYFISAELQERVWHNRPHIEGLLVPTSDRRMTRAERDMFSQAIAQKTVWTQEKIQLIRPKIFKEASIQVVSVNTSGTGEHVDACLFDDIVNFKNSNKPEKCKAITEWAKDMLSVLDPPRLEEVAPPSETFPFGFKEWLGGEIVINGTLYFKKDYYAHILERVKEGRQNYKVFCRNVHIDGDPLNGVKGTPESGFIFPEKFSQKYLDELKEELVDEAGSLRRFSSQYYLIVLDDEERTFKTDQIVFLPDNAFSILPDGTIQIRRSAEDVRSFRPIIAYDPAVSQTERADYTAMVVVGMDAFRDVYLLDVVKDKLLPGAAVDALYQLADKWKISKVVIETGRGLQDVMFHTIRQEFTKRRALSLIKFLPTGDKKTRIENAMEPLISNSKFVTFHHAYKKIQTELEFFPSTSEHDDAIDAISTAFLHLQPSKIAEFKRRREVTRHIEINTRFGGTR